MKYKGKRHRCNNYVKTTSCIRVDRSGNMTKKTTTESGGQANDLFLITQGTVRNTARIPMIPRDVMMDIILTGLNGNELGKDLQHLSLAYAYRNGQGRSCGYMAEVVSELSGGLKIKWYMVINASAIPVLNDEVGRVSVIIGTDEIESRGPALVKGEAIILKRKQAEIFTRYRDIHANHSAIYRTNQQQQRIRGLFEAVQKRPTKGSGLMVRLFDRVQEYMITSMAKDQYLKVTVDAAGNGRLSDESFYTAPGKSVATPRYDRSYVDKEALTPILLELFCREVE